MSNILSFLIAILIWAVVIAFATINFKLFALVFVSILVVVFGLRILLVTATIVRDFIIHPLTESFLQREIR